ncbi:MAG: GNAT family N-acetyltransferase [Candidatus Nanopelagicales bacterium]
MTEARRAQAANRGPVTALVVDAFRADPLLRWVWPDDARYSPCAPMFFGLLFDLRTAGGEVWVVEEDGFIASTALWNPPGGLYAPAPPDAWDDLRAGFTAEERERWDLNDTAFQDVVPAEPHWYLGVLATDPSRTRRGLGRAVVSPMLQSADRTRTVAVLETANEANIPFYRSLGFEVTAEDRLSDGPAVWLMQRLPAG